MNGEWFKIKGVKYTDPDTVEFSKPFEPPLQPLTMHRVRCNGDTQLKEYNCSFEPAGQGTLTENGIRDRTEAKVVSGQWYWEGRKKP